MRPQTSNPVAIAIRKKLFRIIGSGGSISHHGAGKNPYIYTIYPLVYDTLGVGTLYYELARKGVWLVPLSLSSG